MQAPDAYPVQFHVVVGLVEKPHKPVNLVFGFLAELPYRAEDFLREVLGADVVRRAHIQSGCNSCEYAVGPVGSSNPVALERFHSAEQA